MKIIDSMLIILDLFFSAEAFFFTIRTVRNEKYQALTVIIPHIKKSFLKDMAVMCTMALIVIIIVISFVFVFRKIAVLLIASIMSCYIAYLLCHIQRKALSCVKVLEIRNSENNN